MKKAHGSRRENIACEGCGSKDVIKKGRSKAKFQSKQVYKCKDCGKRFVSGLGKSYPSKIIMDSITAYNLGNDLNETSKIIKKKYKIKVPEKTIYSWVKEFDKVCSYFRIRKKALKLFKPKDIIFQKIFRHLQLYKFRFHKAKLEFFADGYFRGLKNYLSDISENCPSELFKDSNRSSRIKLSIDADKIKIFEKKNYACKLASLALESANNNFERHDKLQEFMLVNDTCTIATEVPVYLFLEEVKEYGILNLFNNLSIKNTIKNKGGNGYLRTKYSTLPSTHPSQVEQNSAITGHIDFVQLKFGSVYVLDYKPNASKVDAVSQLFVYAVALSIRTGIWLRNFRCAWFDENEYYEFAPSDIVLRFCKVPRHKFREFFVRNKERRYFTSKEFQKSRVSDEKNSIFKRDNNLGNVSPHNIGGIAQRSLDMDFCQSRIIVPDNFFSADINSEKPKNIANHDSCAVKSELSMADFGVCSDVFVDFEPHTIYSDNPLFKAADIGKAISNLSRFSQYIGKISYYISKYGGLMSYWKVVFR